MIINIETSGSICSVAVSHDGMVLYQLEDTEGMKHAERLAPFLEKCMDYIRSRGAEPDAIAVSIGPGSYTGLRIGLSAAKGLCFGLGKPLICIDTLKILAVKAMFGVHDWTGEEILVPMIDARRMEVYTAAYTFALEPLISSRPEILTEHSYESLGTERQIYCFGDGSDKFRPLCTERRNIRFIENLLPHARDMIALSEKALRDSDFADVAYSVPEYLKEYRTTCAKNPLL